VEDIASSSDGSCRLLHSIFAACPAPALFPPKLSSTAPPPPPPPPLLQTYDYAKMYEKMVKPAFIFDGRNILDHEVCVEAGRGWVGGQGTAQSVGCSGGDSWAPASSGRQGQPSALLPRPAQAGFVGCAALEPRRCRPCPRLPPSAALLLPPALARPQALRKIGFVVYALGQPIEPFLQKS
jgi:hypothetical protein